MASTQSALYYLENIGLTDVILPFVLVFTVIFAILQKAKIFGAESKKYNVIFSLVVSLLVVIPHVTGQYPAGADVVDIINQSIPAVSVLVIAVIMFLVLAGIFFEPKGGGWVSGLVLLLSIIAVTWIFGKAAGWWYNMPFWLNDPDVQALVVIILVFGIIIWFVTSESTGEGLGDKFKKFVDSAFGK
ncbi:hypothetical protein JW707_00120 [Candidatus Woesearchaeota archaeon]|nr:hypothetical protein [Candidatus Woesearchaeota archaeon]